MIHGSRKAPLTATYVKRRAMLGASVVFSLLAVWGIHHVLAVNHLIHTGVPKLAPLYAVLFVMLVWQTFYGYFEKPHVATPEQWGQLQQLNIAIIVPLYNEDPQIVRESIESMLQQTRPIQAISVCDDGSNLVDYYEVEQWFHDACDQAGVYGYWTRTVNQGKRHAQVEASRHVTWCDVYALVDSDSLLDVEATEQALHGFGDVNVMSVASMVAAANTRQNIFTRVMDLWYVALQFTDRSIMSRFNSVLVNYGALAYYRAEVLNDNIDAYLNETFMGKSMKISDDSLLTLFALMKGKTVQQITSWAFTYMPTNFKHHKNQQIRWMRGSFIRSLWRFRYLPMARFAFWGHLFKWVQYVVATAAFFGVLLTQDMTNPKTVGLILLIQSCIYYGVMLRYLSVRRSDESFWYQLGTWAMTPIAAMWAATFLRVWRWWAMITCINMAWGTRNKVEVVAGRAGHRRAVPRFKIAFASFVLVAAFFGFGGWMLSNTKPDDNSIVAQAGKAGIPLVEDLTPYTPRRPAPEPTPTARPVKIDATQAPRPYIPPTRERAVRPSERPSTARTTPAPARTTPTARPTHPRPSGRPSTHPSGPSLPPVIVIPPSSGSPSTPVEEPSLPDENLSTDPNPGTGIGEIIDDIVEGTDDGSIETGDRSAEPDSRSGDDGSGGGVQHAGSDSTGSGD